MTRLLTLAFLLASTPAAAQPPAPVIEYYHLDAIGSVRAVTDASGTVVRRHDYAPFGEDLATVLGADQLRFAGKERDFESGLDYSMARFYAAKWGRFTTVDPGHVGGNVFDSQSWNAYGYARNNPLRFADPRGMWYYVAVDGGTPFTINDDRDLWKYKIGGFEFRKGGVYNAAGQQVGTYLHVEDMVMLAADIAYRSKPAHDIAAAGVVLMAGAGAAAGAGALGTPALITLSPVLPVVPSALEKLQRVGLTLQQASRIVNSPTVTRFIDRGNHNTINVVQQVGDKLVRITLDPSGQRIISAGYIQARNIANSLASGRFVPK